MLWLCASSQSPQSVKRAIKTHGSNRKKPGLKTQVNSEKGEEKRREEKRERAPYKTIFDISYLCLH